jgi:uncharacterized membrane protein YoaT (DUF817 family)
LPRISALSRGHGYPGQQTGWRMASIEKLGSWYLLVIFSFGLVAAAHTGGQKPEVRIRGAGR